MKDSERLSRLKKARWYVSTIGTADPEVPILTSIIRKPRKVRFRTGRSMKYAENMEKISVDTAKVILDRYQKLYDTYERLFNANPSEELQIALRGYVKQLMWRLVFWRQQHARMLEAIKV